jgi:spermidine/putrescine transport system permease protein
MLRFSVTPEVNAASTVLIVVTVILTAVGLQMQNQTPKPKKADA